VERIQELKKKRLALRGKVALGKNKIIEVLVLDKMERN